MKEIFVGSKRCSISLFDNGLWGRGSSSSRKVAILFLLSAALLLTSCPGNGGADNIYGETYGGTGSSASASSTRSSGSGGSYTASFSFDEFMRLSGAGDTDALIRMFRDDSASSGGGGEYGVDPLFFAADDLGVPDGGSVTLSITGGDEDYEETATVDDDGMLCFQVPRQLVGSEITIIMKVKKADGTVVLSGKKTQVVEAGSQFSIVLGPENFVQVGSILVCIHEVTQGEYEAYCGYGGTNPSASYGVGPDYPAYYVSWYDALVYCNRRSMAEGLTPCYSIGGSTDPAVWGAVPTSNNATWNNAICSPSADGYRLPTETEWEQAANDGHTYSGSETVGDVAWYADNSGTGGGSYLSGGRPHEVKTKAPNSLGLYDMSGNVWEWCWDIYSSSNRVIRGGGWDRSASDCAVSSRGEGDPRNRNSYDGFRVVRKAD